MENPEALIYAEKHGWSIDRFDEKTSTYFFSKGRIKINFYDGKRSAGLSVPGKPMRYLRQIWVDELEAIFSNTGRAFGAGYLERNYENRNPFFSRKHLANTITTYTNNAEN